VLFLPHVMSMLTVTTMKDRIFVPVGWDSVGTAKRAKVRKKR